VYHGSISPVARECPVIEGDTSLGGLRVRRVLDRVAAERGLPEAIVLDNGPEFRGRALAAWSEERGVRLEFIQPGKPVQNAYVESFNGRLRDECLNANWFTSLSDARRKIQSLSNPGKAVRTAMLGIVQKWSNVTRHPSSPLLSWCVVKK
jgi:putative transposase